MDHKFFKPQRLGPKIFLVLPFLWTKNCFDQNCFFNSFLNPKIIFKPNNFWIQNYIEANIFGAKIVLDQIVFNSKILNPKFFYLKLVWTQTIFWTRNWNTFEPFFLLHLFYPRLWYISLGWFFMLWPTFNNNKKIVMGFDKIEIKLAINLIPSCFQ